MYSGLATLYLSRGGGGGGGGGGGEMATEDDKFVGERKAEKVTVHIWGKKGELHVERTRNRSSILIEIRLGLILIGIFQTCRHLLNHW